mmetsp:Transcript_5335/g.18030  ORF Transcript_5335/g.18030 Transcript_5335/m.18030 type:complete len:509 (-) Transcript_5335:121-1647(-)
MRGRAEKPGPVISKFQWAPTQAFARDLRLATGSRRPAARAAPPPTRPRRVVRRERGEAVRAELVIARDGDARGREHLKHVGQDAAVEAREAVHADGMLEARRRAAVHGHPGDARRLHARSHEVERIGAQHGECGGHHAARQEHGELGLAPGALVGLADGLAEHRAGGQVDGRVGHHPGEGGPQALVEGHRALRGVDGAHAAPHSAVGAPPGHGHARLDHLQGVDERLRGHARAPPAHKTLREGHVLRVRGEGLLEALEEEELGRRLRRDLGAVDPVAPEEGEDAPVEEHRPRHLKETAPAAARRRGLQEGPQAVKGRGAGAAHGPCDPARGELDPHLGPGVRVLPAAGVPGHLVRGPSRVKGRRVNEIVKHGHGVHVGHEHEAVLELLEGDGAVAVPVEERHKGAQLVVGDFHPGALHRHAHLCARERPVAAQLVVAQPTPRLPDVRGAQSDELLELLQVDDAVLVAVYPREERFHHLRAAREAQVAEAVRELVLLDEAVLVEVDGGK